MKYLLIPFLENCSVQHVVDTETRFSAAKFVEKHGKLYGQTVESIWPALEARWFLIFTGSRDRFRGNQRSTFTFMEGKSLVNPEEFQCSFLVSVCMAH